MKRSLSSPQVGSTTPKFLTGAVSVDSQAAPSSSRPYPPINTIIERREAIERVIPRRLAPESSRYHGDRSIGPTPSRLCTALEPVTASSLSAFPLSRQIPRLLSSLTESAVSIGADSKSLRALNSVLLKTATSRHRGESHPGLPQIDQLSALPYLRKAQSRPDSCYLNQ